MKKLLIIILLLFPFQSEAALTFGTATSDRVSHLSPASLDNLVGITIIQWIYPTTFTAGRTLYDKRNSSGRGIQLRILDTSGNLRFEKHHADVGNNSEQCITNDSALTLNTWNFLAVTGDTSVAGSSNTCHVYTGSLTTIARERAYGTNFDSGSTATMTDGAETVFVANNRANNASLQGQMAVVMVFNRMLSLAEIRQQQFKPTCTSGCVLFSNYGFNSTVNAVDWSGKRNTGTIVGGVVSRHVPIKIF